jgi:hypothetical protein
MFQHLHFFAADSNLVWLFLCFVGRQKGRRLLCFSAFLEDVKGSKFHLGLAEAE